MENALIGVVEQGCKANTAIDAASEMIDSMTKTMVFFVLQYSCRQRKVSSKTLYRL